jgi:predicted acetyltransferase
MSDDAYGPLRDGDLPAVLDILSWCFHFAVEDARAWLESSGMEHVRVHREGGAPVACLILIPMGQWVAGRAVPMTGVAAVGSAPEHRGRSAAASLMEGVVRELRQRRIPLAGLYPATRALYRRSGFELAGARYQGASRIAAIKVRASEPAVRAATDLDTAAIVALYREHAARMNGFLDRGDYVWNRVRTPRTGPPPRAYVIEGARGLEGYFYVSQRPSSVPDQVDLRVTDQVMTSGAAARRALSFIAHHWTLTDRLLVSTGPADPFALAFAEESFKSELWHHFMLRVVDVEQALTARGYATGFEVEVELELTDDLVPDNAGRWVIAIADGHARVRRGGSGAIRLDVRGLAPLYSGHLGPAALRAAGLLDGDDRALARAALAFASQAPWMPDGF